MTEQDIIDAAEHADIMWSGADVPFGWLRHFLDALGKQQEERNFCPRCGKRAGKNDWDVHTCSLPEPEQEPVAWVSEIAEEAELMLEKPRFRAVPLYTDPPQRTWVGLTDEEIDTWNIVGHESLREFVRAIEAALKEKNT